MLSLLPNGYIRAIDTERLQETPMSVRSIKDVAAAVRGRRQDLGISQVELASRAGVSRKWISEFEAGKPTAEFGLVLRVLDTLALSLELRETPALQEGSSQDRGAVDLDLLLNRLRADHATRDQQ